MAAVGTATAGWAAIGMATAGWAAADRSGGGGGVAAEASAAVVSWANRDLVRAVGHVGGGQCRSLTDGEVGRGAGSLSRGKVRVAGMCCRNER